MDDHTEAATEIDHETLRAIMAVQLEDIESLASRSKGKQREGTATDAQVALQIYIEDLHACDASVANRDAAQRMFNAVTRDIPEIVESWRRDDQIARDHKLARRIASVSRKPVGGSNSKRSKKVHFLEASGGKSSGVASVQARKNLEGDSTPISQPKTRPSTKDSPKSIQSVTTQPSTSIASPRASTANAGKSMLSQRGSVIREPPAIGVSSQSNSPESKLCVACNEEKQLVVEAPCQHKHRYCRECIVKLFELASRDESLFPPRCDGVAVPLDNVRPFLSLELLRGYETRAKEINANDRTYCHNGWCRAFIPTESAAVGRAKCQRCGAKTCTTCKGSAHAGDCPRDIAMQQLQLIAQKQQWQRCYSCKRFVQLEIGCHHIT